MVISILLKLHFDKLKFTVNLWWQFCSDRTRIKSLLRWLKKIVMVSKKLHVSKHPKRSFRIWSPSLIVLNDLACERRRVFKGGPASGEFAPSTFNFRTIKNWATISQERLSLHVYKEMTDTLTWQILEISLFQHQMTGKIAEENLMSIKT